MASTTVISGNAQTNNNSTIANGGDVQTGFSSVTPAQLSAVHGNVRVPLSGSFNNNIVTGADNALMVAERYVGKGYSTVLAGSIATPLAIGGIAKGAAAGPIFGSSGVWTTDYIEWSYVSGNVTSSSTSHTDFGKDEEACVTRALPGKFTYLGTGGTPTNDTYDAKTNG